MGVHVTNRIKGRKTQSSSWMEERNISIIVVVDLRCIIVLILLWRRILWEVFRRRISRWRNSLIQFLNTRKLPQKKIADVYDSEFCWKITLFGSFGWMAIRVVRKVWMPSYRYWSNVSSSECFISYDTAVLSNNYKLLKLEEGYQNYYNIPFASLMQITNTSKNFLTFYFTLTFFVYILKQ